MSRKQRNLIENPTLDNEQLSGEPETEQFVLTLLRDTLSEETLAALHQVLAQHGFRVQRSRSLTPINSECKCFEFVIAGAPTSLDSLRTALLELSHSSGMDLAVRAQGRDYRYFKLAVFDMDSTLIDAEVIDELAKEMGVGEQVASLTAAATRGEMDFQQSFRKRVALLKGLSEKQLKPVAERIPLMNGAERLFRVLKRLGIRTAVCSGGFTFMAERLQQKLGLDYVHANELEVKEGVVTGEVLLPILDGSRKAELVKQLVARERIGLDQVIAVGDGANDLPMINLAGMGIAFHAKPVVRAGARYSLSYASLDALLYLIGLHEEEIRALQ